MIARDRPNVQQVRKQAEQLRRELEVKRISVSAAATDLARFCQDHHREDCLVVGFTSQKDNPFKPKSTFSCSIF